MPDEKGLPAEEILGESQTPAAEVTPESTPATPAEEAEKQSRYQQRIDQLTRARREAEERARIAEQRAMMAEQSRFQPQQPEPKEREDMVGEMTRDKWNEWHEEDPVAATRYVSRLEAKAVADEKTKEVMTGISRQNAVQETINQVFQAHPELKDVMEGRKHPDEVPFWQVYDEVARELEDAKYLVKGPYIVMKEAERRMKERDLELKTSKIKEEAVMNEKERQAQVSAGHTAGSSPRPSSKGPVKLTPEEETIARKMRLTPEEYAKYKS